VRLQEIVIVGAGAQTPLGRTAPASAAAVRAGISRLAEHPYLMGRSGEPLTVARAGYVDDGLELEARLAALGVAAATEATATLSSMGGGIPPVALLLGLPRLKAEGGAEAQERVISAVARGLLPGVALAAAQVFDQGHVSGMLALERGVALLQEGSIGFCIIGGIESYFDDGRLTALGEAGRLLGDDNPWGFAPGEGAGFLLLTRGDVARRLQLEPLARVVAAASTSEPINHAEGVCTGEGLSRCFGQVLDVLPQESRVDQLLGDLNGEPHRAEELGYALCRHGERLVDHDRVSSPATCWGDLGAASGTLLVMLATQWGLMDRLAGPLSLCWCSDDRGARAGVLLQAVPSQQGSIS